MAGLQRGAGRGRKPQRPALGRPPPPPPPARLAPGGHRLYRRPRPHAENTRVLLRLQGPGPEARQRRLGRERGGVSGLGGSLRRMRGER